MNWWAYASSAARSISARPALRETIGDVIGDRVLEEDGFLDDHADLAAQAAKLHFANVVAVDANRARIDLPETREQVHERRLAAAVGADQGDRFTVRHGKVDSGENGRALVVAERQILDLDRVAMPRQSRPALVFRHARPPVHQAADAVGRRRGALDFRVDIRQLADRIGRRGQHRVEGEQVLDRHRLGGKLKAKKSKVQVNRLVEHKVRAGEQSDDNGGKSEHFEDRVAHRVDHRDSDALAVEVLCLVEESSALYSLGAERLDHLDTLEALLEDLVDRGHALERAPDGPLHDLADAVGRGA